MSRLIASEVVDDGNRKLIYGHPQWDDYHIIADPKEEVQIGDTVEYEPCGVNFGWFKGVISEPRKR